ncbi:MAG: hypothetical protein HY291_00250 [Planctomycetes bacterium]|nr:hypothetical protein [Planctomycetota bacterium]
MRLEMEGKEPLIVLFGMPLVTTAIVIVSMHYGQTNTQIVPPPAINVEAPAVSPRITAEIPQGSIRINNEVPPAQIHEVTREVVKVPNISIEPARSPDIRLTLPSGKESETKINAVPAPLPMPVNVSNDNPKSELPELPRKDHAAKTESPETASAKKDEVKQAEPQDPSGRLLPPPKAYVDPRNTPSAR